MLHLKAVRFHSTIHGRKGCVGWKRSSGIIAYMKKVIRSLIHKRVVQQLGLFNLENRANKRRGLRLADMGRNLRVTFCMPGKTTREQCLVNENRNHW